jgi:hypothetical protein
VTPGLSSSTPEARGAGRAADLASDWGCSIDFFRVLLRGIIDFFRVLFLGRGGGFEFSRIFEGLATDCIATKY